MTGAVCHSLEEALWLSVTTRAEYEAACILQEISFVATVAALKINSSLRPHVCPSQLLERQVLEESEHRLPPHQDERGPVQLEYAAVDQLNCVPERTTTINAKVGTYVLPVPSRSGFCSSRL